MKTNHTKDEHSPASETLKKLTKLSQDYGLYDTPKDERSSEIPNTEPITTSSAHKNEQSEVRGIEDSVQRVVDEFNTHELVLDHEDNYYIKGTTEDLASAVKLALTHLQEQHEAEKRELYEALENQLYGMNLNITNKEMQNMFRELTYVASKHGLSTKE